MGVVPVLGHPRPGVLARACDTARGSGWRGVLLAALLIPELAYDVYLQVVFVSCLKDISLGRGAEWGHVHHAALGSDR